MWWRDPTKIPKVNGISKEGIYCRQWQGMAYFLTQSAHFKDANQGEMRGEGRLAFRITSKTYGSTERPRQATAVYELHHNPWILGFGGAQATPSDLHMLISSCCCLLSILLVTSVAVILRQARTQWRHYRQPSEGFFWFVDTIVFSCGRAPMPVALWSRSRNFSLPR